MTHEQHHEQHHHAGDLGALVRLARLPGRPWRVIVRAATEAECHRLLLDTPCAGPVPRLDHPARWRGPQREEPMKFASTRQARGQEALLKRRCRSALSCHRGRAKAAGVLKLPYGLDDLLTLVGSATTCAYCRCPLGFGTLQFDHKQPTARGGLHALGNLAVACSRCNALKGMLTADEFALLRELLAKLHPIASEDLQRRLLSGGVRYAGR